MLFEPELGLPNPNLSPCETNTQLKCQGLCHEEAIRCQGHRSDRQCPLSPPAGRTSCGLCPSRSPSGVRCWLVGTKGWVTLLSSGWMALHQVGGDAGAEAVGKDRC